MIEILNLKAVSKIENGRKQKVGNNRKEVETGERVETTYVIEIRNLENP